MLFNVWVTTACNLKCKYCYEGNHANGIQMSEETAMQVLNYMHRKIEGISGYIVVNYHGGEPLLNYEISDRERLETLSSFKNFEKLYPDKIENCKKCDVNLFCWTCLHFADIYIDTDNFQERCQAKKEALGKLIWDME